MWSTPNFKGLSKMEKRAEDNRKRALNIKFEQDSSVA